MKVKCKCGRVYDLRDRKLIERKPGRIICKCGETVHEWRGFSTWEVERVQGLPEDEGQPWPFRYD